MIFDSSAFDIILIHEIKTKIVKKFAVAAQSSGEGGSSVSQRSFIYGATHVAVAGVQ